MQFSEATLPCAGKKESYTSAIFMSRRLSAHLLLTYLGFGEE